MGDRFRMFRSCSLYDSANDSELFLNYDVSARVPRNVQRVCLLMFACLAFLLRKICKFHHVDPS